MKQRSLRTRISIWTAGATGAALLLLAVSTVAYIYLENLEAIDGHIRGEMLEFAVEVANDEIGTEDFTVDEFEPWLVMGLYSRAGDRIAATPHFPVELAVEPTSTTAPFFHQGDRARWRILTTIQNEHILVVAHDLAEFDDVQRDLITAQLLFVPLVAALTAWLSWLVAGRALSPLRAATLTAASIGTGDLSQRLPLAREDDEIGQFTQVLNGMLDRIEKNYNQARQFAGDASHELSTPLTIIKGEIERTLELDHLASATEERLLSVAQEVDRMHQIIDQLLLLARFDAGRASHEFSTLNLSTLLESLAEDVDLLAANRQIQIQSEVAKNLSVHGDASHVRRLLLNLFTNAVKYNVEGGTLHYRLSARHHRLIFEIGNTGPPIPPIYRESIFERFFQCDQSHSRKGSGLGLSLCREIAHAHGGEISYCPSPEFTNRFVVELPEANSLPPV